MESENSSLFKYIGKYEKLIEKTINCMNIPIKQRQISNLFFKRLINWVVVNWDLSSKGFSLETKKSRDENIAETILIKKHVFISIKSEIYPLKKVPKNTAIILEARIIVDDLNLSFFGKKLE